MYADDYLKLSKVVPDLHYVGNCISLKTPTSEIVSRYFSAHPKDYIEELNNFDALNGESLDPRRRAFLFVVCFNEDKNLKNLVWNYAMQGDYDLYEVCFVVNYPDDVNSERNSMNLNRFEKSIETILSEKERTGMKNVHLVSKAFSKDVAGLARARKYGMDYLLYRMKKYGHPAIDKSVIISNEGDTLSIPENYILSYIRLFDNDRSFLSQGSIEYPSELIGKHKLLSIYTDCREAVHMGLGLHPEHFTQFGGTMPIGRNFGVRPRLCIQAGGIEPIRRVETDDDITFGWDIMFNKGEKRFTPIPLVTNPRREVGIVESILRGDEETMFNVYKEFHKNPHIYDLSYEDVKQITASLIFASYGKEAIDKTVNQFFSWLLREEYKLHFVGNHEFKDICERYRKHEMGYFVKESLLSDFMRKAGNLPAIVSDNAALWFNYLNKCLGLKFQIEYKGLDSELHVI